MHGHENYQHACCIWTNIDPQSPFQGLVVPVIRNADTMNFADIEKQINAFAKKANDGTLSIDEMAGFHQDSIMIDWFLK